MAGPVSPTSTVIVLLRAVNLGPHNKVPMPAFRELLTELGARNVVSYVASGQAVAEIDGDPGAFGDRVHQGILDRFGLDIDVFTRTPAELQAIVAGNPFPELAATPKRLHVTFLDTTPDAARIAEIGTRHGEDEFAVGDRALYLAYLGSSHDSPILKALRRLGGRQTSRNWTTVLKLVELSAGRG